MSRELPRKPNLEHLQKQAKELLRQMQENDATVKLADAQHALAHDYGFASWPTLKEQVEAVARARQPVEMLAVAVRASDANGVARALETYPELKGRINEPMAGYEGGMQALLAAVQRGDRATIDVLLRAGADIHARSHWWAGGIGVLDECGEDLAPFLLERGAVLDAHAAARLGMTAELRSLVSADATLAGARGANGQTPLHCASSVEIARFLLERGAEIDARDVLHESTPAQHMLRVVQGRHYRRDRQEIARFLVSRGCRTDILMAAALGDLALVERHYNADPDCIRTRVTEAYFPKQDARSEGTIYLEIFGRQRTPHLVARDFGHEEIFQFLMEHSPEDVKISQAFELGDERIFRKLVAGRANLIATLTAAEMRQLPDAAQNNNTAAVKLMLAAGWPVDARGEHDLTALGWGAWHGNAEMVREILRYGPQIECKDHPQGYTVMVSVLHGSENSWHRNTGDYAATLEALIEAGAKPPRLTDDLEASEAVREVLRRYEAG